MVEYCPLPLLFQAAVSIAGVFQVNHWQHSARQSGKGHTPHLLGGAILCTWSLPVYSNSCH